MAVRVLVVHPGPAFSVADVHRGWTTALRRLGCDVYSFPYDDRLQFYTNVELDGQPLHPAMATQMASRGLGDACYEYWPDIVLVVSSFFVPARMFDLWAHRPHHVVLLFTESPYEDDRQLAQAVEADPALVLVNDPVNIDRYRTHLGDRVHYMPHAYDPDIHRPSRTPDPRWQADFTFVGTGYPSRIEFLDAVDWTGLDVTLSGHWKGLPDGSPLRKFVVHDIDDCYDNDQAVHLYQSAGCSANLYRAGRGTVTEANRPELTAGWAVGPREVELAACGTFFAREPRGESDLLFPTLPTFATPDDLGDIIRWAKHHPDERAVAADGARRAITDRTFDGNARRMLQLVAP